MFNTETELSVITYWFRYIYYRRPLPAQDAVTSFDPCISPVLTLWFPSQPSIYSKQMKEKQLPSLSHSNNSLPEVCLRSKVYKKKEEYAYVHIFIVGVLNH